MRYATGRNLLLLALLLGALLRVPGWYTADEKARWRLFEVDEEQHVAIAMHNFNNWGDSTAVIRNKFHDRSYNVRGYGTTVAAVLRTKYALGSELPTFADVVMTGRQLSTFFALCLIGVVFALGRLGGLSPPAAGVAALLMAACDVNATYSHYMLPASGYVLFCYLALLSGVRLVRNDSAWALLGLAVGCGGALAFKFDVFPTVWGGILLLTLVIFGRGRGCSATGEAGRLPKLPAWYLPAALVLLAGVFLVFTYDWSWEEIEYSFNRLRKANRDVISHEDHLRDNLITYPMGVLAGIGLPAFGLAVIGAVRLVRTRLADWRQPLAFRNLAVWYPAAFLLTEFGLRWYMDTTFIRRVNVFMPAVALLAAYVLQRRRVRPWLTALVIAWSFGLGVVGQSNHWFDPRIAMRDWANEELPKPTKVGISASINIEGLKNWRYYLKLDWEYFITSEAFYRRYTKSMTTPFGVPPCEGGIYHGGPADQCEDFQAMHNGTHPGVELVKEFRTTDIFPERILYHHLFGYYETFLGDVRVFKRTAPPRADRTTS